MEMYKERMWQLRVFRYGLHLYDFTVLFSSRSSFNRTAHVWVEKKAAEAYFKVPILQILRRTMRIS
jgi:hypothetical protein